jgi:hypothetical protein
MFRTLDETMFVAGQIGPEDIGAARALGVTMIVNNRPDGEEPAQPAGATIEEAARAGAARAPAPRQFAYKRNRKVAPGPPFREQDVSKGLASRPNGPVPGRREQQLSTMVSLAAERRYWMS